jgi:DNA-directed RNA polymerase specialized sigma24 family protein
LKRQGYTYKEIAVRTNDPPHMVKKRVRRACLTIRKYRPIDEKE